jgi:hypothetical protein
LRQRWRAGSAWTGRRRIPRRGKPFSRRPGVSRWLLVRFLACSLIVPGGNFEEIGPAIALEQLKTAVAHEAARRPKQGPDPPRGVAPRSNIARYSRSSRLAIRGPRPSGPSTSSGRPEPVEGRCDARVSPRAASLA